MKRVILSDVIDNLESGSRPKGGVSGESGTIPTLGAEHLDGDGGISFANPKYISSDFFRAMNRGHVQKNDVLVVKDGATTGKVSFIDDKFIFPEAAINEHVFRLAVNQDKALPKYIYYYLSSSVGKRQILSDFRGATIGGISQGFLDKVRLPLAEMQKQRLIVEILDQANDLRCKRKESLRLLAGSIHAMFYEMFGNPIDNSRQWDMKAVGEVLQEIQGGESPVCEGGPRSSLSQRAILKLGAVTSCYYRPEENKALAESFILGRTVEVLPGMVLFSRKNTYDLVGASAYVFSTPPKLLLPDTIFNLVYKKDEITGQYLWVLFTDPGFKKKIQNLASGTSGSMPNISMKRLMALEMPVPPIAHQKKFSTFVDHVEELKQEMKRSLCEMDNQFNALIQKYFSFEDGNG